MSLEVSDLALRVLGGFEHLGRRVHRVLVTELVQGERVHHAVLLRVFFHKRSNRRVVQFDIATFFTLRDGLIAEIREVIDSFDLVEQVLERDVSAVLTGKPEEI